jgi:putative ABC transport system substrate-binding protein
LKITHKFCGPGTSASGTLGIEVAPLEVRQAEDMAPSVERIKGRTDALYVCPDPLISTNRVRINALALAAHLPTMHAVKEYVEDGRSDVLWAALSGPGRRAGDYVDRILRGAKPGDLPIEQPTQIRCLLRRMSLYLGTFRT